MAQAKKKTATKTAKKSMNMQRSMNMQKRSGSRSNTRTAKKQSMQQGSNIFFVMSMTALAATLLIANLIMLTV